MGFSVAGAGGLLWGIAWWDDRRRLVSLAALCRVTSLVLLAIAVGALRTVLFLDDPPHRLHRQAASVMALDEPTAITGIVADAPTQSQQTTRFTLAVQTWTHGERSRPASGRVRVTLRTSPWDDDPAPFPYVFQGDRLRLHGNLRTPPGPRNPADFDYGAYLHRRGIRATMYVSRPEDVRIVKRRTGILTRAVTDARTRVRASISVYVPSDTSRAILRALLLGDRSQVEDDQKEAFARTGLMHLLAVSGLHVLLVGMVLYTLLRPILHRLRLSWNAVEWLRAGSTMAVLVLYMLLTGSSPSVVRAVVMAGLLIGSILLQRTTHTLNTLGVAATVLLMARPTALFDAGFQLSMSAVAGIVVLNPRLEDACQRVLPEHLTNHAAGEWLMSMITVSIAATLGTAPVLLHHFGFVAIGGLILNVVAIPLTATGLTAGLLMILTSTHASAGALAFGAASDIALRALTETASFGASWMSVGAHLANPSGWTLAAIVAGLFALAQFPRRRYRWRLIVVAFFLCTSGFYHPLFKGEAEPKLDLVFLDVGQGDAVVVSTPDNHHMLVDAGPRTPFSDAGASVVVPHLQYAGIDELDFVVATHPDSDHLGGVPSVMRSVRTHAFLHSGRESSSELFRESRSLLQEHDIPSRAVATGDQFMLGEDVSIDVLGPPPLHASASWEENDASVVLMISYGDTRVLLPGDIERKGEMWLVQHFAEKLTSDVVKVAHHGSSTSSHPLFVDALASDTSRGLLAVIPVGRFNQFGMPVPDVLTQWQSDGYAVYRTDVHGAVRVSSDGSQVSVCPFIPQSKDRQCTW